MPLAPAAQKASMEARESPEIRISPAITALLETKEQIYQSTAIGMPGDHGPDARSRVEWATSARKEVSPPTLSTEG